MIFLGWMSLLTMTAAPVELTLLNGEQQTGVLQTMSAKEVSLQPESGPALVISTADLLDLRLGGDRPSAAPNNGPVVRVQLMDGSQLQLTGLKSAAKDLQGRHSLLGEVRLPLTTVRSLRFAAPDAKFDPLWVQLTEKGTRSDMVVVQKTEVLDHLDGVVGPMDDAAIKFLLDGDEITVKRDKAFGVIYARKPTNAKLAAQVELSNGDRLAVKTLTSDGNVWKLDASTGLTWTIPVTDLTRADFSLGKVVYLSAMEPRSVKYSRLLEFPAGTIIYGEYRRDRNLDGRPLRLNGKTYARGLAIHSKTEMVYRLGGEFRRFQAMMGIDDEITNTRWGATSVRISGDRKELYAGVCRPRENPIPLDLDVQGVIELEIVVDMGPDKEDTSDRLHFGDARVVK